MNQRSTIKIKSKKITSEPPELINAILRELRLLRTEINLLFPQEDIKEYAHADRVRRSYKKAMKQYPPLSV